MKESRALRITIITIVLLVLCNLSLIVILWLKPGPPPRPNNESPRNFLVRNLQFGESQIKQYDSLIAIHQGDMKRLRDESKNLREQLFSKLGTNYNQSQIDSFTQQIGKNQAATESATFSHFNNVRTICTEGQKKDFDKVIGDLIKRMGQNDRPGRDRNDGEHRPPHGTGRPDWPPPPPYGGPEDRQGPPPPPPGAPDNRPGPQPQQ